jgi:hypothetical protein
LKFIVVFFLQGVCPNQCKKRGCGTIKGKTVINKRVKEHTQKLSIEFSANRGGPIGPNAHAFVDEIVLLIRKWAPLIGVNSWKDIKEEVKEQIIEEMLVCCVLFFPYSCRILILLNI